MTEHQSKRVLHLTTSGFRSQLVEIAPEAQNSPSKRINDIEHEDKDLDHNLIELDVGTRNRNKAFQDRLDEVWNSTSGWEAKLRTEAVEAVETISNMKEDYEKQIIKFNQSLQDELASIFNKFDKVELPAATSRIDIIEINLNLFVSKTAPETMDHLVGKVSRQLKKSYETFNIEQQKEAKRESKFVARANKHIQATAQKFHDEDALIDSCFFNLEDEVNEYERRSARMHLRRLDNASNEIITLNAISKQETQTRESEDLDVLDTVIETQQLLQRNIITHFGRDNPQNGEESGGGAIIDSKKFAKLAKRLSRKPSKAVETKKDFR